MDAGTEIIDNATVMNVVPGNHVADGPGKAAGHRMELFLPVAPNRWEIIRPEIQVSQTDALCSRSHDFVSGEAIVAAVSVHADGVAPYLVETAVGNLAVLRILKIKGIAAGGGPVTI